jgi:hypothetical protein
MHAPGARIGESMTTDQRLDRLTGIVDALAASVVAHDSQIGSLIKAAEKHQAWLNTLPRQ